MDLSRLCLHALLAAVAASIPSPPAHAWSSDTPLPAAQRVDLAPDAFAADRQGGYWAGGTAGGRAVVVHYDASGRVVRTRFFEHLPPAGSAALDSGVGLDVLDDGGVLVSHRGEVNELERWDVSGRRLWQKKFSCDGYAATGDGGYWCVPFGLPSQPQPLQRFGPDAVAGVSLLPAGLGFGTTDTLQDKVGLLARRDSNDVLLYGTFAALGAPVDAPRAGSVALVAADGTVRWTWRSNAGESGSRLIQVVNSDAGDVYGVGSVAVAGVPRLYVVALSAQGQKLWDYVSDADDASSLADARAAGADLMLLLRGDGTRNAALLRFAHGGTRGPRVPLDAGVYPVRFAPAAPGGNERGVSILAQAGGVDRHGIFLRYANDGRLLAGTSTVHDLSGAVTLAGGSTVVASGALGATSGYEMLRFDADGQSETPPSVSAVAPAGRVVSMHVVGRDGASYVVTTADPGRCCTTPLNAAPNDVLERVEGPGQRRWQAAMPAAARVLGTDAGSDRVCALLLDRTGVPDSSVHAPLSLECRRAGDGSLLWHADLALRAAGGTARVRLAADGSVAVLADGSMIAASGYIDAAILRFGADGALLQSNAAPHHVDALLAADGTAVLQSDLPDLTLNYTSADGHIVRTVQVGIGASISTPGLLARAEDGSVVVAGHCDYANYPDAGKLCLARIAIDGSVAWRRTLGAASPATAVALSADAVYAATLPRSEHPRSSSPAVTGAVARVRLSDGQVEWQRPLSGPATGQVGLVFDRNANRPVFLTSTNGRVRLQTLDPAVGDVLHDRVEPCAAAPCALDALRVDTTGTLRLATTTDDTSAGSLPHLLTLASAGTVPPLMRLGQPGLDGAWYPTYAPGQGVFFDFVPSASVLFGAWFTYAPDALTPEFDGFAPYDRAAQRWYTLQAVVPPGVTDLTLPILETAQGAFAAPPVVTAHPVGSARLSATDCSHATLAYHFDAEHNGGAAGVVSLTRLSPATTDCVLADGSTQAVVVAAARGFDARMAGSWYEPATSGQGLEFTVQPNGIFFAGWFTFDPAAAADDATQQHWFTLQGDLAQAQDGVVSVPIVQTVGGSFDAEPTADIYVVGTATLRMHGCDRADLDYRFDAGELAGSYAGRSGTLPLQKIGGCP